MVGTWRRVSWARAAALSGWKAARRPSSDARSRPDPRAATGALELRDVVASAPGLPAILQGVAEPAGRSRAASPVGRWATSRLWQDPFSMGAWWTSAIQGWVLLGRRQWEAGTWVWAPGYLPGTSMSLLFDLIIRHVDHGKTSLLDKIRSSK